MVVDPDDDLDVQRAIESLGNRREGRIVVTPTPGNHGGGVLYQDILCAAGYPGRPEWLRLNKRISTTAVKVLRRRRITDLVVLRAHRLNSGSLFHLGQLVHWTPLRVWLIVHGCRPRGDLLWSMRARGVPVRVSKPGAPPLTCLPGVPDRQCQFA